MFFRADRQGLYRANLHLRTATRVWVQAGNFFRAAGAEELRRRAAALPWERFVEPGTPVIVRVHQRKSRLHHTGLITDAVLEGLARRLGRESPLRRAGEDEAVDDARLLLVRLEHDRCTVRIDSSGEALHRRGWRRATAKAPLRETLAAAMLMAAGWRPGAALLDPLCGSGTLVIEAACMAMGRAAGIDRDFGFLGWPEADTALWRRLLARAAEEAVTASPAPLRGFDRDAGAIAVAAANAERAGVGGCVEFACRPLSALETGASAPGWVVTNPPWGSRIGRGGDLRNLYAQIGNVLRRRCPGWHVALASASPLLLGHVGLELAPLLSTTSGGKRVQLVGGVVADRTAPDQGAKASS